ncbi:MAG: type I phosphomannose isomerase catalytic subunit [Planctomycetota bacterium]
MLTPFLLERRLLPKVWGGRALATELGIPLPDGPDPYGESWELFDRPDGSSGVRGSDLTLADLIQRDPEALVGRGVRLGHNGTFPLLLKFIDAQQGLSLQVHPDDQQTRTDMGKNECCLILRSDVNGRIVHGVKPGVDRDDFLARWETEEVEQMLYSFRPEAGDLVHIPPGTPHGIGPGILCFEVQENSDVTYRFYDWGRGRETHTDDARDVVRMVVNERPPVQRTTSLSDGGELMLATEHFVVRRYETDRAIQMPTHGRYLTVTALGGAGRLSWQIDGVAGELLLGRADTALVPACVEKVTVEPVGSPAKLDFVACDPGAV